MLRNNTKFLIENLPLGNGRRWQVLDPKTREMAHACRWDHAVMVAKELEKQVFPPEPLKPRLTQKQIDGAGQHRKGFAFMLSQLRNAVFGHSGIGDVKRFTKAIESESAVLGE